MARTIRDARTDSRSARLKLKADKEPCWVKLSKGCYLGYRKGFTEGGSWIARYRDAAGKQNFRALGAADDAMEADGGSILTSDQAQRLAREWFEQVANAEADGQGKGPFSVADCMADYLEYVRQHKKSHHHLKTYIDAYILPRLGTVDTAKLTSGMIRKWHQQIATEPPRLRTRKGQEQKHREEDANPGEAERKRKLRANRHLVTLRAALNRAWQEGRIARNDAWVRVKQFPGTERARSRFLNADEARRLMNTCPPDLRQLVQLALLSGARYGELCALDVRDFQADTGTLFIRDSKSGKPRHIILNAEGSGFCKRLVLDKDLKSPLLTKEDGTRWERDHHHRAFKEAVKRAKLDPSFTFHELRHTWASLTIMAGAPLMVVAQNLGHRDTRMVERHYGHLSDSYVSEMIRKTAPTYGIGDSENVVPLAG